MLRHIDPSRAGALALGGVSNAGNTCTSSVLLQELSSFPEIYEPLLHRHLPQGDARRQLQAHLAVCVQELKEGRSVTLYMTMELNRLLLGLGWLQEQLSFFHRYFYPLSALFSPLPSGSPYDLYQLVIPMMQDVEETKNRIVVLQKDSHETFQEAIRNAFPQIDPAPFCLWRVAKEYQEEAAFEDNFHLNGFTFTLKMVLSCQQKGSSNHVVAYRKMEDQWTLLDDSRVTAVHEPATTGVYMVLYEAVLNS